MAKIINSTYEIIQKLGSGGGGTVYLANHLRLGKKVVLKADKRKITTRPELLRREVDILKELNHPNIPRVYDFFADEKTETVYTVMDYIEGESLDKSLKTHGKFSQPQVIEWACQLLRALEYLHSPIHGSPPKGYIHRDIKPANLMRRPDNTVCLIDFNIAFALGEKTVFGSSAGYASPEHYGLDFSSDSELTANEITESVTGGTQTLQGDVISETETVNCNDEAAEQNNTTVTVENVSTATGKIVVTDVRSDIYSVGATLYHLLSGKRPAKNAKEVVPLSEMEYSPQVIQIISKAMNPNPDLRYQSAGEMLDAFEHLHENDSRMKRWKHCRMLAGILLPIVFLVGVIFAFTGLKRMQTTESWLKLAEYSQNALQDGDVENAVAYALQAFPESKNIFTPAFIPEAQTALTEAIGVYDLSDGYKLYDAIEFPAGPFDMVISPDGTTAAVVYRKKVAIFDTESAQIMTELPAEDSALAEVRYLDSDTIIYAGQDGISVYEISTGTVKWVGKPATSISVSGDGSCVAAVYKEENFATIYETQSGQIKATVEFGDNCQQVTVNDSFANPKDNLLALNYDGTVLGVSFSNGSLQLFQVESKGENIQVLEPGSGYSHFEGGYFQQYFAFSASNTESSVFAIVDTEKMVQTGGFESESAFGVQADESGIYVQSGNYLVKIDPVSGEQKPLVTTSENIFHFDVSNSGTLAATEEGILFFDNDANMVASFANDEEINFVQIAGETALTGSRDSAVVQIMKFENNQESEIFTYDPAYGHDEARVSADGETVMLFSYEGFRIYSINGAMIQEVEIPNAEQVYDQQFVREGDRSWLEVTYNDGTKNLYDAGDGTLFGEEKGEKPDSEMDEEFVTDNFRIESPLHGTAAVYDRKTGRYIRSLDEDAFLTYVTQADNYVIVQYVTSGGEYYGELLNENGEVLAELPYLSDVIGSTLIFDYPAGNLRQSHIYKIEELIQMAQESD